MEEVDSIIIDFLKKIDINVPDVKNLCEMPVEVIVESALMCLKKINPTLKLSGKCPSGVSHRIEVASQIAAMCKDMGYKNDVGYQTFLYCNETDLRHIFMFLIEHLPNENEQSLVTTQSEKGQYDIHKHIGNIIYEELNRVWIPRSCYINPNYSPKNLTLRDKNSKANFISESELVEKLKLHSISSTQNVPSNQLDEPKDGINRDKDECLVITDSLIDLKKNALNLRETFHILESEISNLELEYSQSKNKMLNADAELNNVLEILKSIGLENPSAENASDLLKKVQKSIVQLHLRSENVNSSIFDIKQQILEHLNLQNLDGSERNKYKNHLISLKDTAKSLKEEYEAKDKIISQLKNNYEKVKKGNKRSMYTKRILEIINNVDKQNIEISKVLEDTRQLQKEINSLEGQLERCFTIADETLYQDATKDDEAKKAYKLLALLHSECNSIVTFINDTGMLAREIVDLEDNIKNEKAKKNEETLERIQNDLETMEVEYFA